MWKGALPGTSCFYQSAGGFIEKVTKSGFLSKKLLLLAAPFLAAGLVATDGTVESIPRDKKKASGRTPTKATKRENYDGVLT